MELLMMLLWGIIDFSKIDEGFTPLTVEEQRIEKIESDRIFDEEAKEIDDLLNTLLN